MESLHAKGRVRRSLVPGAAGVRVLLVVIAVGMAVGAYGNSGFAQGTAGDAQLLKESQESLKPLPKDAATSESPITPERVELGRKLFFDPRVSIDGTVSCARCHQAALYGTDGLPKSHGAHDKLNPRRAPTVLNVALQFKAHWRGDRENVEDQAEKALTGPPSFGNPDNASAMARLKAIPEYVALFEKAFPNERDAVSVGNWGKAIGAYERTLVTPSRFDEYLVGKSDALSVAEKRGLREFINVGCVDCHHGATVGGNSFKKFGVEQDYWKLTGSKEPDKGRFDVTKDVADMYVFKVAGLRNVAMTPPYFHDGSVSTLPDAVRTMAQAQLGEKLTDQQTDDIVAFLTSLTGKLPDNFVNAPVLPAAGFQSVPTSNGAEKSK